MIRLVIQHNSLVILTLSAAKWKVLRLFVLVFLRMTNC